MIKLVMHTCCAPCMVAVVDTLKKENEEKDEANKLDITAFWYNPNIHPKVEYEKRKNTLIQYCKDIDLPLSIEESYGMVDFVKHVVDNRLNESATRCEYCYTLRLEESFRYAKEHNMDAVTTTLLISPYQNQELIKKVGEKLATKYGVSFYYEDFRPYFRQGQNKARELGLYRQKFCGCIYSIDSGKWER
ncbi:MAG: epoxyqueuosine reductase QueH [Clostridia bacterium]